MEDQLSELQILFMDQLRNMETMSEQLIAQAKRLNQLEQKLTLLETRINQAQGLSMGTQESVDEVPPHY